MRRTVANLLTLAQVDDGRLELLTTRVSLQELVDGAVRPLLPVAAARGVRLVVEEASAEAQADPQRLHQAVTNLVENALKFTPRGGTVRVTEWRTEDEVGITVADDGPGIPAA